MELGVFLELDKIWGDRLVTKGISGCYVVVLDEARGWSSRELKYSNMTLKGRGAVTNNYILHMLSLPDKIKLCCSDILNMQEECEINEKIN